MKVPVTDHTRASFSSKKECVYTEVYSVFFKVFSVCGPYCPKPKTQNPGERA